MNRCLTCSTNYLSVVGRIGCLTPFSTSKQVYQSMNLALLVLKPPADGSMFRSVERRERVLRDNRRRHVVWPRRPLTDGCWETMMFRQENLHNLLRSDRQLSTGCHSCPVHSSGHSLWPRCINISVLLLVFFVPSYHSHNHFHPPLREHLILPKSPSTSLISFIAFFTLLCLA